MAEPLHVFTIPAGAPFLSVLAEALLDGRLGAIPDLRDDPLALADVTVLLPTRRAVRAFREALIRKLGARGGDPAGHPADRRCRRGGSPPRRPASRPAAERLVLPAAIGRLPRQLALAELTLAWGRAVRRDLLDLAPGRAAAHPGLGRRRRPARRPTSPG